MKRAAFLLIAALFAAGCKDEKPAEVSTTPPVTVGSDDKLTIEPYEPAEGDLVITYSEEEDMLLCSEAGGPNLPCTLDVIKKCFKSMANVNQKKENV